MLCNHYLSSQRGSEVGDRKNQVSRASKQRQRHRALSKRHLATWPNPMSFDYHFCHTDENVWDIERNEVHDIGWKTSRNAQKTTLWEAKQNTWLCYSSFQATSFVLIIVWRCH